MKFRKKPVVIEAYNFTKENFKRHNMPLWLKEAIEKNEVELFSQYGGAVIGGTIKTLEGVMIVSESDWIIKGIKNEIYACKPDIFDQTYEPVE